MAHQTPTAPQPSWTQSTWLNASRQTSMDSTETIMVKRTSLAARRALGSTKASGQMRIEKTAWMHTSCAERA